MKRHFNTTGPVIPEQHYCIDPMTRLDWEDVQHLIGTGKFFVLHAPRQTGKTSTLLSMMDALNQSDEYQCLYINVESAQSARGDVAAGMPKSGSDKRNGRDAVWVYGECNVCHVG